MVMNNKLKVIELNSLDLFRKELLTTIKPEKVERLLRWYLQSYGGVNFKFGYDRPILERESAQMNADIITSVKYIPSTRKM